MFAPFFRVAAVSPGRQKTFRIVVAAHLLLLLACWRLVDVVPAPAGGALLGLLLLSAGIVEGALLLGWRLTQLPKSQALEFVLVSSLRPWQVFVGEAGVGLARLALVTLAGVPVLYLLVLENRLSALDLPLLLAAPWIWGAVTGLGLAVWAYESLTVRYWGERLMMVLVVLYLLIGVLAAEHLGDWLHGLPTGLSGLLIDSFRAFHRYNPFATMKDAMEAPPGEFVGPVLAVELAGVALATLLLARGAGRLLGHFHDRHYRPVADPGSANRGTIGDRPLTWWAVRRVSEYSGRVNLWLAGGFAVLYALYTLAGDAWPAWLGRQVFITFDRMGGVPVLAAALAVFAAVPAAFQYGLWDSSGQDRCRRLELLLLTRLTARDYQEAAAAAAWRRGRGYFGVAILLWVAAALAGRIEPLHALAAMAAAVVLWGLYFALGFRAFSRGMQAGGLGLLLTLGLPLLAWGCYQAGWPVLAGMVPPGSVYQSSVALSLGWWLPGPCLGAVAALGIGRLARQRCDGELRRWYDRHHDLSAAD